MKDYLAQIQDTALLKGLSPQDCERLCACLQKKTFKANSYLFEEGQEAFGVYIVLEGHVKVIRTTLGGKEIMLFLVRPGHIVGEGATFQKKPYPASAVAMRKVQTLFLSTQDCHKLAQEIPLLSIRLLSIFAARQRMLMHKIAAQGERNATARVAGYILHRVILEKNQHSVHLAMPRNDLANLLGLARETVSRQLSFLVDCGAITLEKNTVRIVDMEKLQTSAQG